MRRSVFSAALLLTGFALATAPLSAQGFVGAGVTTPMGDFGDGAKMGWVANAGFRPYQSADKRMSIWAEGLYGSNKHDGAGDDKTNLFGGFGSVTYNLTAEGSAVPYVIGSAGYLVHSYKSGINSSFDDSAGGFGFGGGAGVGIKKLYLEARYLTAKIDGGTTAFIMFTAGITF
ncbi:MAG: hypothetical protein IPO52_05860 [Gemmatimonadetes bacterium]|nr:hypothetical protein [Gemmatimonadota bacterium]